MSEQKPLIDLGNWSEPAKTLIERVSDAVGVLYKPHHIKQIAKAESEAAKIHALAQIEISDLERRALERVIREESKKQENIESITGQAAQQLGDDAKPENLEEDWIANFFDKCRIVSDAEMQSLWAKLLAGEATKPGSYSKRTVSFVSNLDKLDASIFTDLCTYVWEMEDLVPLVIDMDHEIYNSRGINFDAIKHLDDIGLVTYGDFGYQRLDLPKDPIMAYYGASVGIKFPVGRANSLQLGKALFTKVGLELAPICGATRSDEFFHFVLEKWASEGLGPYSPVSFK